MKLFPIRYISIDMPALPSSWEELSGKQMEELYTLRVKAANTEKYKLDAFFMLSNLEIAGFVPQDGDEEPVFLVRRKGRAHRRERTAIRTWEVHYWIDKYLGFLDNPHSVYHCPYPEGLRIGGRLYKCPDPVLSNLTWQQFNEMNRAMKDYFDWSEHLRQLTAEAETHYTARIARDIRSAIQSMDQARVTLLSHLLIPRKQVWFRWVYRLLRLPITDEYGYHIDVAEFIRPEMQKVSDATFYVLLQQVQSALAYYRESFPEIFTASGKSSEGQDQLVMEVNTIDAIKKHANYPLSQNVLDENAILIFPWLVNMHEEAKMYKEMEKKNRKP